FFIILIIRALKKTNSSEVACTFPADVVWMYQTSIERKSRMSKDFEPKSGMTRRSMLHHLVLTGVSAVTFAGVTYDASSVITPTPAFASEATPLEGIDVSHATPDLVRLLTGFFAAKSAHDPSRTISYFSQKKLTYIDAILGWIFPSWQV